MAYYLESESFKLGHVASNMGLRMFREMLDQNKKKFPILHAFIYNGVTKNYKGLASELNIASQTYAKHENHAGILANIAIALKQVISQGVGDKELYLTDGGY